MANFKKAGLWFLICLALAIYAKSAGMTPGMVGKQNAGAVLGQQSTYGSFNNR